MTWPKLIGGAVGCVGIGSCLMLSAYFFTSQRYIDLPFFVGFCCLAIVSVALLALSYFLWCGCSWARTALVALCWLLAFSIGMFFSGGMLQGTVHGRDIFMLVSTIIATASPPIWFAIMLRQPDIVTAFSAKRCRRKTSNQSLQPTAGRCDE